MALAQFLKTHTPAEQQRAIAAIQKQQLFIPAQYASLLTGFPTAETLIRSLYPSANFSRIHDTPFNYANITDVPSFTWSYASILSPREFMNCFPAAITIARPSCYRDASTKILRSGGKGRTARKFCFGIRAITCRCRLCSDCPR